MLAPLGTTLQAIWSATEVLGNVAAAATNPGIKKNEVSRVSEQVRGAVTQEEALERLKEEYVKEYFLSGEMDLSLYENDCVFADPFASFRGKERFKNNLANLGLFISQSEARLLQLSITKTQPLIITSRVMVKLQAKKKSHSGKLIWTVSEFQVTRELIWQIFSLCAAEAAVEARASVALECGARV